jgi:dethiobiotin synthetase
MTHPHIVVTGTDTGIGKTVFAAALTGALGAYYWKPVQAGLEPDGTGDAEAVARLSRQPRERILPNAWRLATPCSPHRAAEIDGVTIDAEALTPPDVDGPLVIEGAGGALVPVTRTVTFADVFARWGLPTVLVARTALGTINHSLLSLEALRGRGVPVLGVAFVGEANADTETTIAEMGRVKRLGRLPHLATLDAPALASAFAANFRVEDFTA